LSSPSRTAGRSGLLLACGTLFICVATLWPFTFEFRPIDWRQFVGAFAVEPSTLLDLPRNIFLFVPFGMGVAWLLDARGMPQRVSLALTAAAGLAMTVSVESLQVFLPGRTPNVSDIWSNAGGAIAGVAVLRAAPRAFAWLRAIAVRVPSLTAAAMVGVNVALAVITSWVLASGVVSQPFGTTTPAIVDGEGVSSGALRDVVVFNRAASPDERRQLLDDQVPSGLRDSLVATQGDAGAAPTQRGRLDSSFTLALTLDRVDRAPAGRAPMLAIAGADATQHLAIAQDETRMALRWRSRFDREGAMRTELEFPGALDPTTRPRRIVISVRGVTASIRTSDGAGDGDILLGPEATLSALLRESDYWPLTLRHTAFWRALVTFGGIVFAVPALLLGAALRRRHAGVAATCGIVLPALCCEAVVAIHGAYALRAAAILTGIAVTAAGFAAGRLVSRRGGLDDWTEVRATSVAALTSARRQSTA
jgi:hypothetical protein